MKYTPLFDKLIQNFCLFLESNVLRLYFHLLFSNLLLTMGCNTIIMTLKKPKKVRNILLKDLPTEDLEDYTNADRIKKSRERALRKYPVQT